MKISMIMTVHNAEGYMRKALDSIRAQRYRDYELICVCDSCKDRSEEIAMEYGATVIPVNYGLAGPSRNKGLEVATGDWVMFMDDDDWLLHEYVFPLVDGMAGAHGEDILMCSFIWKGVGYASQTPERIFAAVWNKVWRREFIGDTRFSDKPYGDDADFHEEMMRKNPNIHFWDMPIYYYNYMRPGSLSDLINQGKLKP